MPLVIKPADMVEQFAKLAMSTEVSALYKAQDRPVGTGGTLKGPELLHSG